MYFYRLAVNKSCSQLNSWENAEILRHRLLVVLSFESTYSTHDDI